MEEFDNEVFTKATRKRNPEEMNILQYIMALAWFKGKDQVELGLKDQNICSLCGEAEDSILHAIWDCKQLYGEGMCNKLKGLCKDDVPKNILLGIPSSMGKEINKTFFGTKLLRVENQRLQHTDHDGN